MLSLLRNAVRVPGGAFVQTGRAASARAVTGIQAATALRQLDNFGPALAKGMGLEKASLAHSRIKSADEAGKVSGDAEALQLVKKRLREVGRAIAAEARRQNKVGTEKSLKSNKSASTAFSRYVKEAREKRYGHKLTTKDLLDKWRDLTPEKRNHYMTRTKKVETVSTASRNKAMTSMRPTEALDPLKAYAARHLPKIYEGIKKKKPSVSQSVALKEAIRLVKRRFDSEP